MPSRRQPEEAVMEAHKTHFFELETDGTLDLLEDSLLDALYEAGCDDALVGHRRLDFARRADTWEATLRSARSRRRVCSRRAHRGRQDRRSRHRGRARYRLRVGGQTLLRPAGVARRSAAAV